MTNIIPISYNPAISPIQTSALKPEGVVSQFQEMFSDALKNYENLDAIKQQDAVDIALGNIDDLSQLQINSEKADIALQLIVEMRNKLVDGYNEIMRMSI